MTDMMLNRRAVLLGLGASALAVAGPALAVAGLPKVVVTRRSDVRLLRRLGRASQGGRLPR